MHCRLGRPWARLNRGLSERGTRQAETPLRGWVLVGNGGCECQKGNMMAKMTIYGADGGRCYLLSRTASWTNQKTGTTLGQIVLAPMS
jgi:hypothetical protein